MRPLPLGNTWILVLQVVSLSGAYFVAETKSSWFGDTNCSIAKPPLQFANGMIKTDISSLQLDDNENIWVGYYTSLVQFEYFGCVRSDAPGINSLQGVTTGDPGQCVSACRKPMLHIGVCKKKCYCLDNVLDVSINTTEHGCDTECSNQPGVACGGEDTSDALYVSLYRSIKRPEVEVQKNVNGGHCLVSNPSAGLAWKQCSKSFIGMCYAGNEVWQSYAQPGQLYFVNWITSADRCFMNNSRPTTFNNSHSVGARTGSPLWTGIICSWVVFNSAVKATERIRYGYLTKEDSASNIYLLSFTDVDSTQAVLCETGSEKTRADNAEQKQSDPNISIAVGVSVFVFILAVSIAVMVFVLNKRGKCPYLFQKSKDSNKSQQPEPDYNYPDFNLRDETVDIDKDLTCSVRNNDTYVSESDEHEQTNNDYFVFEEHEEELNNIETEYDKIESGNTRLNRGINNVHNTLQSDTNATYDRTFINGKIAISANDKTYDNSDISAIKPNGIGENSDNMYNKINETDDDTYNHINTKACTKLDNTYSVPNDQTGGDYDGIYNRTLDNCSSGTRITDNTYTQIKQ